MISKAIQNANDEAKKRVKERQSFIDAEEHAVQSKVGGLQRYVPLGTIEVLGKTIADWLQQLDTTTAKLTTLEKVVNSLVESSAEQAKLLQNIIQTLEGEKL